MEGVPSRGFHRILSRLDEATRNRYCAEAFDEELKELHAQFQHCSEAMRHAKQVDEATRSLTANAATPINVGSSALTQLLTDLSLLHSAFTQAVSVLTAAIPPQMFREPPRTRQDTPPDLHKLLQRLTIILTKRRRETWLNDAMETAKAVVKVVGSQDVVIKEEASSDLDTLIYEAFKLLRKCVLEDLNRHVDHVPVLRKRIKKLAKKRPALHRFLEKSEMLIEDKLKPLNEKAPAEQEPPASKPKKRKLSEPGPPQQHAEIKREQGIQSSKLECFTLVEALHAHFTMNAFDTCLTATIQAVDAVSPDMPSQDIDILVQTLTIMVDKAKSIKDRARREDRLVCLEGLLATLNNTRDLKWPNSIVRNKVKGLLSSCKRQIGALKQTATKCSTSSSAPAATLTNPQPVQVPAVPTHKHRRFD